MFKREAVVLEKKKGEIKLGFVRDKMCGCCSNFFCENQKQFQTLVIRDDLDVSLRDRVVMEVSSRSLVLLSCVFFLFPSFVFMGAVYLKRSSPLEALFLGILSLGIYFHLLKQVFLKRGKLIKFSRVERIQ